MGPVIGSERAGRRQAGPQHEVTVVIRVVFQAAAGIDADGEVDRGARRCLRALVSPSCTTR